jgi:hypothetical protein
MRRSVVHSRGGGNPDANVARSEMATKGVITEGTVAKKLMAI